MDDPVVVKPETVSKIASVKLVIEPLSKNGNVPKIEIKSHEKDTIMKLSFMLGFFPWYFCVLIRSVIPTEKVMKADSEITNRVPS